MIYFILHVFLGPGVLDMVRKSKSERRKLGITSIIEDVYNENVYKTHIDSSAIFRGTIKKEGNLQLHRSFQVNTDRVSAFKSSKFGVWPVYAPINELSIGMDQCQSKCFCIHMYLLVHLSQTVMELMYRKSSTFVL